MKRKSFSSIPLAVTALIIAFTAQAADRTVIQNKGSDTLVNVNGCH
jgi:hypothetical protein